MLMMSHLNEEGEPLYDEDDVQFRWADLPRNVLKMIMKQLGGMWINDVDVAMDTKRSAYRILSKRKRSLDDDEEEKEQDEELKVKREQDHSVNPHAIKRRKVRKREDVIGKGKGKVKREEKEEVEEEKEEEKDVKKVKKVKKEEND
eukprot:TRINITY_DN8492_c0_g4_i1.p1 TRINITY_DN8492_c0_g4~~TRINITY_DN8492_c0_g4_i1.p1  ORF type:complete len:146 (-),score=54.17 TRINITY_DN8492_c0_g4_i1:420-857(-)